MMKYMKRLTLIGLLCLSIPTLAQVQPLTPSALTFTSSSVSTGSANAQKVTSVSGGWSNTIGNSITFVPGFTNNSAMTVSVDGQTAVAVHQNGAAVASGAVVLNQGITLVYNGSSFDIPVSPVQNTPNIGVATGTSLALGGATIGSNALAINGSTLFTDGSTIASTGFNNTATYSGVNPVFNLTPTTTLSGSYGTAINISPTVNFSGTVTGIGNGLNGSFTPAGTSLGDLQAWRMEPIIYNSSVNVTNFEALQAGISQNSYSGTITNGAILSLDVIGGFSAPITNSSAIRFRNGTSNGNGITSGTVTNSGILEGGAWSSAAAAAGGTVNNYGAVFGVANASGAGTTNNRGVYITGNGGSGGAGATNNYALYSDSTALSSIGGQLNIGANSTDSVNITGGSSGGTVSTSAGTLTLSSGGGTTTTLSDTGVKMSGLSVTTTASDYLCGTTSIALFFDSAGTCLVSDMRLKNDEGSIGIFDGLLHIWQDPTAHAFHYKVGYGPTALRQGFFAQDMEKAHPELVTIGQPTDLTPDGTKAFDPVNEIADLVMAVKGLIIWSALLTIWVVILTVRRRK